MLTLCSAKMAPRDVAGGRLCSVWKLLTLAWPVIAGYTVSQTTRLITVVFVSRLGDHFILGAVGLGSMLQNVFGFSIANGLASGLKTLVSQSYGAGEHELSAQYLRQAQITNLLMCVPSMGFLYFSEHFFLWMGLHSRVSYESAQFIRGTLVSMPPFFLYLATADYLQAMKMPRADFYANLVGSGLHPLWCYLFLFVLPWGSFGAGLALACTNLCVFLVLSSCAALGWPNRSPGWRLLPSPFHTTTASTASAASSSTTLPGYLRSAVPAAVLMWTEWWAFEIMSLVAGLCGPVGLAAHTAVGSIVLMFYINALAIGTASVAMVGNAIGEGSPALARDSVHVSVTTTACFFTVTPLLFLPARESVAAWLNLNRDVTAAFCRICLYAAPLILADALETVIESCLQGLHMHAPASQIKTVATFAVRVPLCYALALPLLWGIEGVWCGSLVGITVGLLGNAALLHSADFDRLAAEARQRLLGCEDN